MGAIADALLSHDVTITGEQEEYMGLAAVLLGHSVGSFAYRIMHGERERIRLMFLGESSVTSSTCPECGGIGAYEVLHHDGTKVRSCDACGAEVITHLRRIVTDERHAEGMCERSGCRNGIATYLMLACGPVGLCYEHAAEGKR